MGSWKKVRRALGGSDSRHWRVPGLLELQLRGDYARRAVFSLGLGIAIAAPLSAVMLAIAPPDDLGLAVGLSFLFAAAVIALVFMYRDAATIIISLEDQGLRRKYKPMLVNLLGWRDREDFWEYSSISGCGIVPKDRLGGKYSVIVVAGAEGMFTVIVPEKVKVKEVASFLATQCSQVKAISQIPAEAQPASSVSGKGLTVSSVLGALGVVLCLVSTVARLAIHSDGGSMDTAAVTAAVAETAEGTPLRECLVSDSGGVDQAEISPKGRWIWALTRGKKHLVWNDQQAEPAGQLDIPSAYKTHACFTPNGEKLIVVADTAVHLWQLDPLNEIRRFELEMTPDRIAVTADNQSLVAIMMSSIRLYNLESGQAGDSRAITLGALVDATLSADSSALIIAQQPRILRVSLTDADEKELIAYPSPHKAHLQGRLASGGRWAAMQSKLGTVLYDLSGGKVHAVIAAGPMYADPVISSDGKRLAVSTREGVGVWDTETQKPVVRFPFSNSTSLGLSDNGQYLIGYASRVAKIAVWEMPEP